MRLMMMVSYGINAKEEEEEEDGDDCFPWYTSLSIPYFRGERQNINPINKTKMF